MLNYYGDNFESSRNKFEQRTIRKKKEQHTVLTSTAQIDTMIPSSRKQAAVTPRNALLDISISKHSCPPQPRVISFYMPHFTDKTNICTYMKILSNMNEIKENSNKPKGKAHLVNQISDDVNQLEGQQSHNYHHIDRSKKLSVCLPLVRIENSCKVQW